MTAELMGRLVAGWVRFYTRGLPTPIAERRVLEIDADLYDHISAERANGTRDARIALGILSRMARGVTADVSWRHEHAGRVENNGSSRRGATTMHRAAYAIAATLALGAMLLLAWGVVAMGVIGVEGGPFDLAYFGVLAVGVIGAAAARFEPRGMARALLAMALAQGLVTAIALALGKHEVPVSSVTEILGLNAFFVALFVGSAWLFERAARQRPRAGAGPS